MRNKRGQNLVEYVLFVAAVLLVCIYFFTAGPMSQSVNTSLYTIVNQVNNPPNNTQIKFQ